MTSCPRDVDDFQLRTRFAQKGHNWWRNMCIWLWHWNQKQKPRLKKARQVWSIMKVLLIIFFAYNGVVYHEFYCKDVWSIIIPSGYAQIPRFRNPQNYRKSNHRFCIVKTFQHTDRCLWVNFWSKIKPSSCLNHHIHRVWHTLSFSSSQNLRPQRKESVLLRLWR